MTGCTEPWVAAALTESEADLLRTRRLLSLERNAQGLSVWDAAPMDLSFPSLAVWDRTGDVVLGVPGPTADATAAQFDGHSELNVLRDVAGPFWTISASVYLNSGSDSGTIVAVDDPSAPQGPTRALIVRRGRLAVLGWSWRGGLASWGTLETDFPTGRWVHVAATLGQNGDLILFTDGRVRRVFNSESLHPGRQGFQRVRVGGATTFVDYPIPGWHGRLQHVALHDQALTIAEVERLASAALPRPEPEQQARPARVAVPDMTGCDAPAHSPAWRDDDGHGLRCLRCEPPRGCSHDNHQEHWRPAGDVYRVGDGWKLECGLCITAAKQEPAPVG